MPRKRLDGDEHFAELFSLANLRATWKTIRREMRDHSFRDPVDFMDWAAGLDSSLTQLRQRVLDENHIPSDPSRYEEPKAKGSFRLITVPSLADALIFRLVADH